MLPAAKCRTWIDARRSRLTTRRRWLRAVYDVEEHCHLVPAMRPRGVCRHFVDRTQALSGCSLGTQHTLRPGRQSSTCPHQPQHSKPRKENGEGAGYSKSRQIAVHAEVQ